MEPSHGRSSKVGEKKEMGETDDIMEVVKKEAVDLETIPLEEVFENLRCSKEGLTSQDAGNRLEIFGYNKLEEKEESKFLKFLGFMWNPLSWVMEVASVMAIALANGEGKPPDWQDFVGIRLAGFCWDYYIVHHKFNDKLYRGEQCW